MEYGSIVEEYAAMPALERRSLPPALLQECA